MQPQCELHLPRLRLRALVAADAPDVFAYASDLCVTKFVDWQCHRSIQDSLAFIERTQSAYWQGITFAVELTEQRRVIGTVELRVTSRVDAVAEMGYVLARPFWGQGYNVEAGAGLLYYAFRIEHLRRVEARCAPDNRRSFRTLEKLAMRREFTLGSGREDATGRLRFLYYSLTSTEWMRHPLHRGWRNQILVSLLQRTEG